MQEPNFEPIRPAEPTQLQPRRRLRLISTGIIYLLIIFGIIGVVFSFGVISSGEKLSKSFGNIGLVDQLKRLVGAGDRTLQGEGENRINILLIGMGGSGHDGPYLADTMQLVSFQPEDGSVALTSIPRDLLAPIPGYGLRKINNANAFGEVQNPGAGGELATQVVSQILDLPIPYYARIDFNGFVQIVDDLNGVVIDVENTLDDRSYPVPGKETATTTERYQHLHIPAGRQKMDGELALKYVRSRSAIGAEGSDFARSKRQQNLLLAIKDKVVSFGTLANPIRISNLMETFSQHFTSNLELWEISRLLKLAKNVDEENITRIVFDDSPDGLLQASLTADGAFVLTPKAGDFSELQAVVHNVFNPDQPAKLRPQKVEIQNGTRVNGLAYDVSLYLQSLGFNVIKTGNAPTQDYARTVVYDLKKNDVENKTREIVELLNADQAPTLPEWLTATSSTLVSPNADIVIILGQDQRP